ncbi:MAG: hypothetical protein PF795_11645 [Kiritimatiellae bacterium]|jgi:hypothetical protein|nr:hypothetical protein [Kiritimatiellia bacterium]
MWYIRQLPAVMKHSAHRFIRGFYMLLFGGTNAMAERGKQLDLDLSHAEES